ncbi:MAG: 1,4-dihydroxy-2-naphthoate octaprenyltransferase [Lentisphaeria bacterium]
MIKFIKKWLLIARIHTIPIAIAPILMGLYCSKQINYFAAIITILSAIFIQFGTNLTNDFCDYKSGVDKPNRVGPKRALAEGETSENAVLFAAIFCFIIATISGLYLTFLGGWQIALIGISGIFFAIIYTAGPFPAYNGYSELLTLFYFGPIATIGTMIVQQQSPTSKAFALGLMCGLFSVIVLTINNIRDFHSDKLAGKNTLIVKLGRKFALTILWSAILIIALIVLLLKFPLYAILFLLPTFAVTFAISNISNTTIYNNLLKIVVLNELFVALIFVLLF